MDTRTEAQKARAKEYAARSAFLLRLSKNRLNRLKQHEQRLGRELTAAELKEYYGGLVSER